MILKALCDYYNSLPTELKVPSGCEYKKIEYIIVIDENGEFLRIESKRIDKNQCAKFIVPKGVNSTNNRDANTLWDNAKYVLGIGDKNGTCNAKFIETIRQIASEHSENKSIQAVKNFYDKPQAQIILEMSMDPLYSEIEKNTSANISFQLLGEIEIVAEMSDLFPQQNDESSGLDGICLITGEKGPIVRLTSPIKGKSLLVSFQKDRGYDSYGKKQAYNAPISIKAEFEYTSALKKMLAENSKNEFKIGNRTYLFWGTGKSDIIKETESCFSFLINDPQKTNDQDVDLFKVQKLFKAIWSGGIKTGLEDKFFILGLVFPENYKGRITVVEWSEMSLKEFAGKILLHLESMTIVDNRPESVRKPYSGIYSMISAVALEGKASNLSEALFKSILGGASYPYELYTSALQRIRANLYDKEDSAVLLYYSESFLQRIANLYKENREKFENIVKELSCEITRYAILKAYINRINKLSINIKPLTEMLDKTNDNPGYLCGRLVAVLEKIQSDAKSGDSIRTRYMSAASSTPSSVFPAMLNLTVHHSKKLSDGARIYYEQLKQEIIEKLSATGFPAQLNLNDQGRFFVGYYHQRADLYTKQDANK